MPGNVTAWVAFVEGETKLMFQLKTISELTKRENKLFF